MPDALIDQTVLVTGAGRGLGTSIAVAMAREGARVAVKYRDSAAGAAAVVDRLGDRAVAFRADVRDPVAVERMVADVADRLGEMTVVVHNAPADYRLNGDR